MNIAEEYRKVTKKGYELAEKLRPSIGDDIYILGTCSLICRHATTHSRLQEEQCNGMPEWRESQVVAKEKWVEQHIRNLCRRLPQMDGQDIRPVFQGDPRGATVKLKMPDGRYDDWGQTGLCVPGS